MKQRNAIKNDQFAADHHRQKIDRLAIRSPRSSSTSTLLL